LTRHLVRLFFRLAVFARVNAIGQQAPGIVAPLTGLAQGHVWIGAKGKHFGLALKPVTQSPPLAARRLNLNRQAAIVGQ
jgi:hypothetical protein